MEPQLPSGFVWDREIRLGTPEVLALSDLAWPNYLRLPSDIPEPGHQFRLSRKEFERRFPIWGIRAADSGALVAFIHGVLTSVDLDSKNLPDDGWRFAIRTAPEVKAPNCLCLVVASVLPEFRRHGLTQLLIERAKNSARDQGFKFMIAPVRPTAKHQFPFEPIDEYVKRVSPEGEIFDPWLRLHVKSGAEISNVCHNSVVVQATLGKWREWTGLPIIDAKEITLPMGLVPLEVKLNENIGIYREPNVWVRYRVCKQLTLPEEFTKIS